MKDLLIYLLNNLVDNVDQVTVDEAVDESGLVTLKATVAPEDMGKVIGKGGKVINSIRQIVKIKAIKEGKRVQVTLSEPEGAPVKPKSEESEPEGAEVKSKSPASQPAPEVEPKAATPEVSQPQAPQKDADSSSNPNSD